MKRLTAILVLIAGFAISCESDSSADDQTGDLERLSPQEETELLAQANALFGPLPASMPGSEHDTEAQVKLGEKLYFEKRLSIDNSQSCNTCHPLDGNKAGADNLPTSVGAHGKNGDAQLTNCSECWVPLPTVLGWKGRRPG